MRQKTLMTQTILNWFKRNFSDPEALGLFFVLLISFILFELFGKILIPVFVSIIIAYLLNSAVVWLVKLKLPRILAIWIVYLFFVSMLMLAVFGLLPLLWRQTTNVITELPHAFNGGQLWLTHMMQQYPNLFGGDPLTQVAVFLKAQSAKIGQELLTYSIASIPSILQYVIYLVLVPLLVFFFLKDGALISKWISRFLPTNRGLTQSVWADVHKKIGSYVHGRVIEIFIVGIISIIAFNLLGMQYAFLMGALVGLSVIIPYIGAVMVTIPLFIFGLMQWGLSAHFGYFVMVYAIIITLDANILFPLLFSEAMELHPLIIILSVLVFGGIWGFWGVFFAIPLATLVKAVLDAWPKPKMPKAEVEESSIAEDSANTSV